MTESNSMIKKVQIFLFGCVCFFNISCATHSRKPSIENITKNRSSVFIPKDVLDIALKTAELNGKEINKYDIFSCHIPSKNFFSIVFDIKPEIRKKQFLKDWEEGVVRRHQFTITVDRSGNAEFR